MGRRDQEFFAISFVLRHFYFNVLVGSSATPKDLIPCIGHPVSRAVRGGSMKGGASVFSMLLGRLQRAKYAVLHEPPCHFIPGCGPSSTHSGLPRDPAWLETEGEQGCILAFCLLGPRFLVLTGSEKHHGSCPAAKRARAGQTSLSPVRFLLGRDVHSTLTDCLPAPGEASLFTCTVLSLL